MPKQTLLTSVTSKVRNIALVCAALAVGGGMSLAAHADQYDDQINALHDQNTIVKGVLNGLESQAGSYQQAIGQFQAQINGVESQIAANQTQQTTLQQQITDAQTKIAEQKKFLGEDIRAMYVDGQLSTIEELATSKNLSEYVDKQTYRTKVQNSLTGLIKEIAALQAKLQIQKGELDTLVASEQQQSAQLSSARYQQQQLLSYNQGQQNDYNSQISNNSGKIGELRRQQIIANTRYNVGNFKGDAGNGGYPNDWAYAAQDSLLDSWGMYNRECVSYTAFKVHQDFLSGKNDHDMPYWGGIGNANQWDDNARDAGIPVDNNPTPGSIAVSNAGFYGHVMYVEAVKGDQIYIQQYNQQLNGQYSEGWRYATGLVFIHF